MRNKIFAEYLDFEEYNERAGATALYLGRGTGTLAYPTLGLCGETGEIAEKVKKILRDNDGVIAQEDADALIKELGDVLWYITALAYELGSDLRTVAITNLIKLESRKERGTLQGSGDDR